MVRKKAAQRKKDPFYDYCRRLPGVTEDIKWGNDLVFSVGDKMFVVFQVPDGEPFGMKADPMVFEALTRKEGIEPAKYLAKHHWISIATRRTLPRAQVFELIREAHAIVASKLSRKKRRELGIALD